MKAMTYHASPGMTGGHLLAAAAAAWLRATQRLIRTAGLAVLEELVATSKAAALIASNSKVRRRF